MTQDPIQTVLTDLATENLNLRIMLAQANTKIAELTEAQKPDVPEAQEPGEQ